MSIGEKGRGEVEIMDLRPVEELLMLDSYYDIAEAIMIKLNEQFKDNWAYMSFYFKEDCIRSQYLSSKPFCRGGVYHISHGPLEAYFEDLYYKALEKFAETEDGRETCKTINGELMCELGTFDILDIFLIFAKRELSEGELILLMYSKDGTIYAFYRRAKEG